MLRSLHIAGFKCFEHLDLAMAPMTLLSGLNGGGKSTVIQSLVLLSQTLNRREWDRTLMLQGPDLALGCAADVLSHFSARRKFTLGATIEAEQVRWTFRARDRRALSVELDSVEVNGAEVKIDGQVRWLLPPDLAEHSQVVSLLRDLWWTTAERTGPRELLPLPDGHARLRVGHRGELAAGLLFWRGQDRVNPGLCLPNVPATLFHQVRGRMQQFFPGCDLRVTRIEGVSAVSLRLRTSARAEFQRPQNVGFGLTQLFPILVTLLAASAGDMVLVENPEVHLHPRAQQDVGRLLAQVASTGVQVIVETHSDHVLNGVRLGVKSGQLAPTDAAIHFFSPSHGDFAPHSPKIDADGRLDRWPEGFFDQFDQAVAELL